MADEDSETAWCDRTMTINEEDLKNFLATLEKMDRKYQKKEETYIEKQDFRYKAAIDKRAKIEFWRELGENMLDLVSED